MHSVVGGMTCGIHLLSQRCCIHHRGYNLNKQYDTLHKLLDAYYAAAVDHCACGGDFGTGDKLGAAEGAIEAYCEALAAHEVEL